MPFTRVPYYEEDDLSLLKDRNDLAVVTNSHNKAFSNGSEVCFSLVR